MKFKLGIMEATEIEAAAIGLQSQGVDKDEEYF
jgi:hypothetical protein